MRTMRAMSRSIMVVDMLVEDVSRGSRALPRAMMLRMESVFEKGVVWLWGGGGSLKVVIDDLAVGLQDL